MANNKKDWGVSVMTEEEWNEDMKHTSDAAKKSMDVEANMHEFHRQLAEKNGKLPDEEWMKKI